MKNSKLLSLFAFGLLLTGFAYAQERGGEVRMMAEPTMMIMEDEMSPRGIEMEMMADEMEMKMMERERGHRECMSGKMGGCGAEKGECSMKKMMQGHHGGSMFLMKFFCGVGMLVFLFLGAFVVRKGWTLGGKSFKCCGKPRKK